MREGIATIGPFQNEEVPTMPQTAKAVRASLGAASSEDHSTRILIVDDHPVVRKGLAAMINLETDLQVCADAEDFHEALAAVKAHAPDLAVVDLTLKDIGGLELVKHLEKSNPNLQVLVCCLSWKRNASPKGLA